MKAEFKPSMLRKLLPIFLILFTACTLNLPQPTSTPAPASTLFVPAEAITNLEGTQWLLQSYVDLKGNPIDVLPGTQVEITFQNAQVLGSAGCNSYIARYQIQADRLDFSTFEGTSKFCTDPEQIMDQEAQYLQTLGTARRFKIVDGRLQLLDVSGQTVLTFIPLIK